MNIAAICGIALMGLITVVVLRAFRAEYAIVVGILTGVIVLFLSIPLMTEMLDYIQEVAGQTAFSVYFSVIFKSLGIGFLAQMTVDICRDAGENAIASKVEFAAKIMILLLCIPILRSLLNLIFDFLQ